MDVEIAPNNINNVRLKLKRLAGRRILVETEQGLFTQSSRKAFSAFCVHTTRSRPKLVVSADGHGVVNHAGSRLLANLADATSLTSAFSDALHRLPPRGTGHDPGRMAVDLAVMLADGGEAIRGLAVLRDQRDVFGPVASTPTAWRVLAGIDTNNLNALRAARAAARGRLAADRRMRRPSSSCPRCVRPGPPMLTLVDEEELEKRAYLRASRPSAG